jgi:signal transduction histidine kinase
VSELRPAVLDDLGLIPAIEWQVKDFRSVLTPAKFERTLRKPILPDRSAAVFRVVQEALTNVMRHAKAKSFVEFEKEKELLKITVSDDGQGLGKIWSRTINPLESLA